MTIYFKAATNYSWMSQASYLDLSAVTPGSANSLVGSLKQNSLNDGKVFADKQAATFVDLAREREKRDASNDGIYGRAA